MTLYPNCTDYPLDVLIVLDSLLVALENEQSNNNEENNLFFNYLAEQYPNIIENGELNLYEASLITELNLDGLGLNNINGIEHFNNLENLSCNNNNLTTIPELPSQITTLSIKSNNLNFINNLPENLIDLDLRYNSLNNVPELPNNMEVLKLCFNNFTTIPDLPDSLRVLFFAYNALDALPIFPPKLEQVLCYNNQITHIGVLPESIETLMIQNNNIISIPDLPNGLQTLDLSNNPIQCVNYFPLHLEEQLLDFSTCIFGCIDQFALNYDINANIDDGTCEYTQSINWPNNTNEINTDANATYLIENLTFNDSIISSGYTIGAFYQNDFDGLSCGGFTEWNGGPYSLAIFSDDLSTEEKDGFSAGDQIFWLAYNSDSSSSDNNTNYIASPTYISGSGLFSSNSINLISNFNILNDTLSLYGCTNEFSINYNEFSFIDDSSCIFPSELTVSELNDSITFLLALVNDLNSELEEILIQNPTEVIATLELALEAWDVIIDLEEGWNMFGYGCPSSIDVAEALYNHAENIIITKDYNGNAYIPEFGYNGIGDFTPGYGYQIKVSQSIEGFSLCDLYHNDLPEANIVSLQDYIVQLEDSLELLNTIDSYQIGDIVEGGIVFYVDETGQHGLVAATEDLNGTYEWGCYEQSVEGADSQWIGSGLQNTNDIVEQSCQTENVGITAAQAVLNAEINGYTDWYLPSSGELYQMYITIGNGSENSNIGGFHNYSYWSSSELNNVDAMGVNFDSGYMSGGNKENTLRVRVIRSF